MDIYVNFTDQIVKWLEEKDVCYRIDGCEEIEVVLVPPEDGLESDHDDANSDDGKVHLWIWEKIF